MMTDINTHNFNNGRFRSFFKSIYKKLNRKDDCLPGLDDIIDITNARNERYVGVKEIPVENIIGSEGRYEDFNRNFFPKKPELQSRWSAIYKVMEEGGELPAISVFKIDDYYFVRDGNHRVSVAKKRGQLFIDAEVTEYDIDVSLTRELTVEDQFMIQEHVNFLEATGLNNLGKGYDIKLSRPRSYRLLLNIIQHFSGPLVESLGRSLTLNEVATEWYSRIFLPFAEGAYLEDLLAKFPNRTTGDLYVWIQVNWEDVKDSLGERMNFLAKPIDLAPADKQAPAVQYVPGMTRGINNQYLRANIGLVVTCIVFNVTRTGEMSIAIVKRKYHPFEDYWSLPIAMVGENETRLDSAARCLRDSLSIKKKLKFVQYKTFDNVDRTPYGRMIAFGMMSIHYSDSYYMEAGDLASEIKFIPLDEHVPLVYDHNHILNDALLYLYNIRNNFTFITDLFPEEMPLRYIRKFLELVRRIQIKKEDPELS
jgi:ADP-ribose pyrophosphatase YjhB (NUDIX family)